MLISHVINRSRQRHISVNSPSIFETLQRYQCVFHCSTKWIIKPTSTASHVLELCGKRKHPERPEIRKIRTSPSWWLLRGTWHKLHVEKNISYLTIKAQVSWTATVSDLSMLLTATMARQQQGKWFLLGHGFVGNWNPKVCSRKTEGGGTYIIASENSQMEGQ